jgi:hypothetical protein
MGRALEAGHQYTLVVTPDWRDEHGLPLARDFATRSASDVHSPTR